MEKGGGRGIKEKRNRLKEVVYSALIKEENMARKKKRVGYEEWWDRSCTKKKEEVHRVYRKWRRGQIYIEEYEKV